MDSKFLLVKITHLPFDVNVRYVSLHHIVSVQYAHVKNQSINLISHEPSNLIMHNIHIFLTTMC